ncbi:unnamed protein product [Auanema sp. JU1783]|nr:unnamed protein product [Auanema sp. JU1783]
MTQAEEVSVRTLVHETRETPANYEIAFSENNPSVSFKETNMTSGDLKSIFGQIDPSSPIAHEILNRARTLCVKHLGGAWADVTLDKFILKPVTGGISNLLFLVELPKDVAVLKSEPSQVVLRVFCQENYDQLIIESVVFTLLSERGLGPKLLGVFPGGRFEEYIPSRPLHCDELSDPKFAKIIAPMVARVHALDVPITKQPEVISTGRDWLRKFRQTPGGQQPIIMRTTETTVDKSRFPEALTIDDLEREWDFVEKFVKSYGSPLVFSHNDLQKGNILLKTGYELCDDGRVLLDGTETSSDPLVLIDFEYSTYNYRGFDFGNHFCEYGFDYDCDSSPYYKVLEDRFKLPDHWRTYCKKYLEETYKTLNTEHSDMSPHSITGNLEEDLEKLVEEASIFMPISHLFWSLWSLVNAESSVIVFDYAAYGRDRLALYFDRKPELEKLLNRQ